MIQDPGYFAFREQSSRYEYVRVNQDPHVQLPLPARISLM
jgi:hypothetical protein